jgi:uncharacterized membrane protein (UPF0136 family)
MDIDTIHRNADRVSSIFNALAMFVLVIGTVVALLALVGGFVGAFNSDSGPSIISGIALALLIAVYTAITWAGVQLSALVAGYIKVRTAPGSTHY